MKTWLVMVFVVPARAAGIRGVMAVFVATWLEWAWVGRSDGAGWFDSGGGHNSYSIVLDVGVMVSMLW